jgi:hypothetical protein
MKRDEMLAMVQEQVSKAASIVCPHCMKEVPLPSNELYLLHRDAEFKPKLVAVPCLLCTELIRLDTCHY